MGKLEMARFAAADASGEQFGGLTADLRATRGASLPERRSAELELRKRPTQARGEVTFRTIMDVTLRLLDEVGVEALTTNLVAEVAGINIATLYQYFPSKESILLELFRRDTDARMKASRELFRRISKTTDWREVTAAIIDELVRHRRAAPGAASLRRAMQWLPALRDYERETMLSGAEFIAEHVLVVNGVESLRARQIAFCAMEAMTAVLDLESFGYSRSLGEDDDWVAGELKSLLIGYFAPYLDN